ncbi:MAG: hypothetical protein OEV78_08400 [Spirochaetia bacterium]|nr:hypothetical protein [Spirochaetia bacterium]
MKIQTKFNLFMAVIFAFIMVFAVNCSGSGEKEDKDGSGTSASCVVTSVGTVNNALNVLSPDHSLTATHGGKQHAASGNVANCSGCHGASLEGNTNYTLAALNSSTGADITGTTPPCCTSCHSVKW